MGRDSRSPTKKARRRVGTIADAKNLKGIKLVKNNILKKIRKRSPARQKELNQHASFIVRRSLELIRDRSTLNVRVLTRSPLARRDFDLFRSFGDRLLFGMSIPTLHNDLARIYEPRAPAPSQRLATLAAAAAAGLHVYVAMAPTYPECDEADLRATLKTLSQLNPITIFHEPINIRADNVARIEAHARSLGVSVNLAVFATRESWETYALQSLKSVKLIVDELGIGRRLHLWPDKALGSQSVVKRMPDPKRYSRWLQRCWARKSEWPCSERRVGFSRLGAVPMQWRRSKPAAELAAA